MRTEKRFISLLTSSLLLGAATAAGAAGVSPISIDATLTVGGSMEVTKEVTTPHCPNLLDLTLMLDLSGSFYDDLNTTQHIAPDLFNYITSCPDIDSAQFGIASFVDVPLDPWGDLSYGDYAYRLDQDLTDDNTTWLTTLNALTTYNGGDGPQNQYIALYQAATGEGMDADGNGIVDPWDVNAGGAPSWRENATHVIAISTDAPFHTPGDSDCNASEGYPCPMAYPGPTRDETVAALNAAGIKVIAIKAPGAGAEMDDLAIATGGAVKMTGEGSEGIGDAIIEALQEMTGDVTYEVTGCAPLEVTLEPALHEDIPGETTVVFDETISVPETTAPGTYDCNVTFKWMDTTFENSTQNISIVVKAKEMAVDIKPQSCPNPINVASKGVLPIAILGSAELDVSTIDPETVTLEGVPALRWDMKDVGTPYPLPEEPTAYHCHEMGADGYTDLTLKFDTQEVINALATKADGDVLTLTVEGQTFEGVYYEGRDVVRILNKKK
jgi:hypothetical protein